MSPMPAAPTALVAEDEPRLARTLIRMLEAAWPELKIVAVAEDGLSAVELAQQHRPDILFLDIKMPGKTGLEVAEAVSDDWEEDLAEPLFVFVTAYDEFAVAAFEHAATDYLLKPVVPDRLQTTVDRLQARLASRAEAPGAGDMAGLLQRVQAITAPPPAEDPGERISVIRAGVGNTVRMIPVEEVLCFEATDKYVNVITASGEALVRLSLREIMSRIDATDFMQVHRSVMVNGKCIESATRDEAGHYSLTIKGLPRKVKVSRAFAHLFRPM